MKKQRLWVLPVIFSILIALPVFAKPDLKLILENNKVIIQNGKEILQSAEKAKPGDVLLYTLKVINNGDEAAYELEPEANIPPNTVYIPEKKDIKDYDVPSWKTSFSIDNGNTFQEKPKIKIKQNGKLILKDAPVELYNKIRWTLPKLEPKKSINLTYKVQVK